MSKKFGRPKKDSPNMVQVGFMIQPELKDKIVKKASKEDITIAELMREIVMSYFNKRKGGLLE